MIKTAFCKIYYYDINTYKHSDLYSKFYSVLSVLKIFFKGVFNNNNYKF
jgi:hypothetical protein